MSSMPSKGACSGGAKSLVRPSLLLDDLVLFFLPTQPQAVRRQCAPIVLGTAQQVVRAMLYFNSKA